MTFLTDKIRARMEDRLKMDIPDNTALKKKTQVEIVSEAVIQCTRGGDDPIDDAYLHASTLFLNPEIQKVVRSAIQLSFTLSHAYAKGLVGRRRIQHGNERFAYGPPNPGTVVVKDAPAKIDATSLVQQKLTPIEVGYQIRLFFSEPTKMLEALERYSKVVHSGGRRFRWGRVKDSADYHITFMFEDKADVLDFLFESGNVSPDITITEVEAEP